MYLMTEKEILTGKNKAMFLNNTREFIDDYRQEMFMSELLSMSGM